MNQKTFEHKNISVCLESPEITREDVEKIIDFLIRKRQFISSVDKYKWRNIKIHPGREKTLFKKILLRIDKKKFIVTIKNLTARIEYIGELRREAEKGMEILEILPLFVQSSNGMTFQLK